MIGQNNILNKLKSYTLSSLPHSILLIGEKGSEQYDICKEVSSYFGMDLDIIEDKPINRELVDQIYENKFISMYVIDLSTITIKEQNVLLKLYEEPNDYAYIVLLAESDSIALETIMTRSYSFKLESYTKEVLEPLIFDPNRKEGYKDLVLSLCSTPGQIEIANITDMVELKNLCTKIVNSLPKASYPNTLSIANKINFKDENEKFNIYMFIKVLSLVILELGEYSLYPYVKELRDNIYAMTYKRCYFENFLTKIWLHTRA